MELVAVALVTVAVVYLAQLCLARSTVWLGGMRWVANVEALRTAVGQPGELVQLAGYSKVGDGGQGLLYYEEGTSRVVDNGMVFDAAGVGRWVRLWDGKFLHADWYGCVHDGIANPSAMADDRDRIQAALNFDTSSYTVLLGKGTYGLASQLVIPDGKTLQGITGGDGGFHSNMNGDATTLRYIGPSALAITDCFISLRAGSVLRTLGLHINTNIHVTAAIGFTGTLISTALCEDVLVSCWAGGWADRGYFRYGYMIGAGAGAQSDNLEVNRGGIINPMRAAVGFAGGQPYNTVFNHVRFDNFVGFSWLTPGMGYTGEAAACSHGIVFEHIAQTHGALTVNGGEIEFFAILAHNHEACMAYVTFNNVEWEGARRMWSYPGYSRSWLPVNFNGGRFSTQEDHTRKTVYDEDGVTVIMEPNDQRLIYDYSGAMITMKSVDIGVGVPSPWQDGFRFFIASHTTLIADGSTFPNLNMVDRFGSDASCGGTYIRGCKGFSSGSAYGLAPYPDHNGTDNPDGFVTIEGGATSIAVALKVYEYGRCGQGSPTAPMVQVEVFPTAASAGCVAEAYKCRVVPVFSDKLHDFTIYLDAAPGEGEWITISYRLTMNRQCLCE